MRLEEIKVKNDLGQEDWYKANRFKLFVEAAAFLKEPLAAGAGQGAAQSATPDGVKVMMEIDATGRKIRKAIVAGIEDRMGIHYGA